MKLRFWRRRKAYLPVSRVAMDHNCVVTVEFQDGHRAVFEPYVQGWGYFAEGLRRFRLYDGLIEVATFNGRLARYGVDGEHQFVYAAYGYNPDRIIRYWESAEHHLNSLYQAYALGHLKPAWSLVTGTAAPYLRRLRGGAYPLPTSVG